MEELIDRDKLIEEIQDEIENGNDSVPVDTLVNKGLAIALRDIMAQPAIESEPIRHGRWIECDYKTLEHGEIESAYKAGICCSECRTGFKKNHMAYKAFCPACGAKMDKEE